LNILNDYLDFLHEQIGVPPRPPVQNPQPSRATTADKVEPNTPVAKKPPVAPNVKIDYSKPAKAYFNYMLWTTKIIKQGEVFRKKCYDDNCGQFEIGTGDRRICKDRCDIETCKKILALLRISMSKCTGAKNPQLCRVRYAQLIPLYQDKLTNISKSYIKAERIQKQTKPEVG
jgi:hypothetical protein